MTCRVYVGEYQDRITGAAATAYVVIPADGAQPLRCGGISLSILGGIYHEKHQQEIR